MAKAEAPVDPTIETAGEYEAQVARPALSELEQRLGAAEEALSNALQRSGELDCTAEQATRMFKSLQIESAQANVDAVQWSFLGGVVLRFALDDEGVGFYRVRLVP